MNSPSDLPIATGDREHSLSYCHALPGTGLREFPRAALRILGASREGAAGKTQVAPRAHLHTDLAAAVGRSRARKQITTSRWHCDFTSNAEGVGADKVMEGKSHACAELHRWHWHITRHAETPGAKVIVWRDAGSGVGPAQIVAADTSVREGLWHVEPTRGGCPLRLVGRHYGPPLVEEHTHDAFTAWWFRRYAQRTSCGTDCRQAQAKDGHCALNLSSSRCMSCARRSRVVTAEC